MKLTDKTKACNEILTKWADGSQVYSLYEHKDMEFHGSFIECEIVEEWFGEDFREKGYDFLEFAYTRSGDPYALWIYPELKGEPPVVLLDSDGEIELLAPSLGDFLCLLTDLDCVSGKIDDENLSWYNIYETVTETMKQEMESLREEISKVEACRPLSEIVTDFNLHPNFKVWFEENFEL